MTITNMEKDVIYAVVTNSDKLAFTSNNIDLAKARRDQVNPEWRIIEITTLYKEC